jgi:hypothetical protein
MKTNACDTQAESGENNLSSSALASTSVVSDFPAKGAAVVEAAKQADAPAEPTSNETNPASTATVKDSLTVADHFRDATKMVNHPLHYQGKVECIDAIESALGGFGFEAFCRGNAMKYIFRAGKKGDASEDLAKARWYLERIAP